MAKANARMNTGLLLTFVIIAALVGAYLFGRSAMELLHGSLKCGTMGEVRSCDNTFTYLVGFYVGMMACLAFAQAAYIKNQIAYFGILALALITLIIFGSSEFVILVFGFSVAGAFAGGIYRRLKLDK